MLMLKYDSHDVISCLGKNKNRLFLIYSFRGTLITSNVSEFHYWIKKLHSREKLIIRIDMQRFITEKKRHSYAFLLNLIRHIVLF